MFRADTIHGYFPHVPVQFHVPFIERPARTLFHRIVKVVQAIFVAIKNFIFNHTQQSVHTGAYHVSYKAPTLTADAKKPYVILALDGGGVRGKITLAALKMIEEILGTNIINLVDCIAGVSTGGIIAAALSVPKPDNPKEARFTAKDVDNLYNTFAEQIFVDSWFDSLNPLSGILKNKYPSPRPVIESIVGNVPLTASIAKNLLITSFDVISENVVCFGNKGLVGNELPDCCMATSENATFLDALEATSAAPTYFPSKVFEQYNLVDGGVAVNNPAQIATLLAMNGEAKERPILIISLGTGKAESDSIDSRESLRWGLVPWIKRIVNVIMGAANSQVNSQLKLLSKINPNISYVRWQVKLKNDKEAQMDRADPAHLKWLENYGTECFRHFLNNGGNEQIIAPLEAIKQALEGA